MPARAAPRAGSTHDDLGRARDARALDDELPDAAGADDEHGRARLDPRREQRRADARQRRAAEQRRLLERHAVARRAAPRAPRRRSALRARRSPCRGSTVSPSSDSPRRAVRQRARRRSRGCSGRQRAGPAARAVRALAARGRPREDDLVADAQRRRRPSPTASTIPAPSCPSTIGVGRVHSPLTEWRSVPQMPTAAMRTSTSPAPRLLEVELADLERPPGLVEDGRRGSSPAERLDRRHRSSSPCETFCSA